MAYLTEIQLKELGFSALGRNVKISDTASIYDCSCIEIGDNSRIDDFCVVSGHLRIGRNVHITPMCLIAGGAPGIIIEDYVTLAYGAKVFSQSDDYSGQTMTNSTIPKQYKNEIMESVLLERFTIVGTSSIVMPGVTLSEGTAVGANSLVLQSTLPWSIVVGSPARWIKERKKDLILLEKQYSLEECL